MVIETQVRNTFWDARTKLLHFGMALVVTFELFSSLVMQEPGPGRAMSGLGGVMFELHEWAGMAALAIVLLHWGWSVWGAGAAGVRHLFPWGAEGRRQFGRELRDLRSVKLPPGGPENRLAGLMHGLGFLAVTVMVVTGGLLFFGMPYGGGELTPMTDFAVEAHEVFATLVWIYWGGHVVMAVVHELIARDGTLRGMFRLS